MKKYENSTDEELILRLRQGEPDIEEYLIEKYKPLVRSRANAMFLIGGENDDLIQEGMIGLFEAIRDYQPDRENSFQRFAALCVQRQLYRAIEVSNRKKHFPLNTYISMSSEPEEGSAGQLFAGEKDNPEVLVIEREYRRQRVALLEEQLSDLERRVLREYLQGYDYLQIAVRLGKPAKSIDNALQRIRQKIRVLDEGAGE